jgi:hypothetical protein
LPVEIKFKRRTQKTTPSPRVVEQINYTTTKDIPLSTRATRQKTGARIPTRIFTSSITSACKYPEKITFKRPKAVKKQTAPKETKKLTWVYAGGEKGEDSQDFILGIPVEPAATTRLTTTPFPHTITLPQLTSINSPLPTVGGQKLKYSNSNSTAIML